MEKLKHKILILSENKCIIQRLELNLNLKEQNQQT